MNDNSREDFYTLTTEMLGLSDLEAANKSYIEDQFSKEFDMSFDAGFRLATALLQYTKPMTTMYQEKYFHAFISPRDPITLMQVDFPMPKKRLGQP